MANKIKGISTEKEQSLNLSRDLTPTTEKIGVFLKGKNFWLFLIPLVVLPSMITELSFLFEIMIVLTLVLANHNINSKEKLPYKKRMTSNHPIDDNEQVNEKPTKPKGITFFGNELNTKKEIWFTDSDVRTHCLIFGTTGSGKTELLLSICVNTLNQASGFIYIDGKGDNSLWAKVFSLVAARGRLDDLYLINYMTSSIKLDKKTTEKISHTMNPCATGNAESLTELIVSLLPGGSGDGMWKGRASVFMGALLKTLVYLRDQGKLLLDIDTIRKYFTIQKIVELTQRDDIPLKYKDGLEQYVINLPGYISPTPSNPNPEQQDTVGEQHGYITMQFTETFGLLADTYGHIMKTQIAEVDFYDIVVNRRILVVLLPALEKSIQNLGNLGRIIIASIKNMMSTTLGSKVEGDREEVIDTKPTNSSSPYMTIFDEYGYYAVEGAAVMPAQARSLGFFMIFAGQDFQAFKKGGSQDEAYSIVANMAIKICLKLEDPGETLKIFQDAAGESESVEVTSFDKKDGSNNYDASRSVSIGKKNIINVRDLRNQGPGEGHILFRDTTKRFNSFFANPKLTSATRVNSFIEVEPPSFEVVKELKIGLRQIEKKFDEIVENQKVYGNSVKKVIDAIGSPELGTLFKFMDYSKSINSESLRGAFSIASYIEKVTFVDNEIITEIRENINQFNKSEEELTEIEISKPTVSPINSKNENDKNNNINSSIDKNEIRKDSAADLYTRFKLEINEKQAIIDKFEKEISFSIFERIGVDFFNVKEKLIEFEESITEKMDNKGLISNNFKNNTKNSSLIAEKALLDAATASIPINFDDFSEKVNNDNEIKDLINDILGDDIDNL